MSIHTYFIFPYRQGSYSVQNRMRTENSALLVWTEAPVVRHCNPVGISPARLICQSDWKWLGDRANRNALLHLFEEGGGGDKRAFWSAILAFTRLSVAWGADVRFSRLRSTCWSSANFMMKSDTDFICRVLCKTSQSINPAAYLLVWQSVAVLDLRSPLILSCLYAFWTFFPPTMQKCIYYAFWGQSCKDLYSVILF
jgi:hypothetical protein